MILSFIILTGTKASGELDGKTQIRIKLKKPNLTWQRPRDILQNGVITVLFGKKLFKI